MGDFTRVDLESHWRIANAIDENHICYYGDCGEPYGLYIMLTPIYRRYGYEGAVS